MSLLLAILRTASTANKFGGGMFVKAMYDRRKRTNPGPRYVDRYDLVSGEPVLLTSPDLGGVNTQGGANPIKTLATASPKFKAVSRSTRELSAILTFTGGPKANTNAERMIQAEMEIRARKNSYNDAAAILLLLAS